MEITQSQQNDEIGRRRGVDEQCAAILRAVHEDRPLRDVFGLGEQFVAEVEQRAHQFYEAEHYEEAETLIRGVSALEPDRFYPHLLLGELLLLQGRLDESGRELERAIELEPDSDEAKLKLAEIYMQQGRMEDARGWIAEVREEATEHSAEESRADVLWRRLERAPSSV